MSRMFVKIEHIETLHKSKEALGRVMKHYGGEEIVTLHLNTSSKHVSGPSNTFVQFPAVVGRRPAEQDTEAMGQVRTPA